jgi:hypothetical protein
LADVDDKIDAKTEKSEGLSSHVAERKYFGKGQEIKDDE